jgi:hypothetical protein
LSLPLFVKLNRLLIALFLFLFFLFCIEVGFLFLVFFLYCLIFFTYTAPIAIDVVTDTDVKIEKKSEIMSSKNTPEKRKKRSLTVSDDDNFEQLVSMGFDVDEVSTLTIMNLYLSCNQFQCVNSTN